MNERNLLHFVNTDFGPYFPAQEEVDEFKRKYGERPLVRVESMVGTRKVPQWDYQITKHATAIMRKQFEREAA